MTDDARSTRNLRGSSSAPPAAPDKPDARDSGPPHARETARGTPEAKRAAERAILSPGREPDCAFCSFKHFRVIIGNDLALALRDEAPVSRGHALILPRRHVASWSETTEDERLAILELIDRVRERHDKELEPDGYNIGINDGPAAGQTVMHVHVHLIPRYTGDVAEPAGGVRHVLKERADPEVIGRIVDPGEKS
jgi:diadenosine tetraphosphate (Ap4A) HIT family hydrolase